MKRKDLIYLVLAVVILLAAGYIAITQLSPKKTSATGSAVVVEVVGAVPDHLSSDGVNKISDTTTVQDYNSPVDLSGLGNTAPFGP